MRAAHRQGTRSNPKPDSGGIGWVFSLVGALASPGQVWAGVTETDFLGDLPVVLSVSRLSQPVNEAPAAVTVIDQDMIRASGFRDIPDMLRLVPGMEQVELTFRADRLRSADPRQRSLSGSGGRTRQARDTR